MCPKQMRLMRRAMATYNSTPLTTTPVVVAPSDIHRVSVLVRGFAGLNVSIAFGLTPQVQPMATINVNSTPLILTYADFGQYIQQPVWGWTSTGVTNDLVFTFISTHPEDWNEFLRS